MLDIPGQPPRLRAFVVRIIADENHCLHGQISEPGSADEWCVTFGSVQELCQILQKRFEFVGPTHEERIE